MSIRMLPSLPGLGFPRFAPCFKNTPRPRPDQSFAQHASRPGRNPLGPADACIPSQVSDLKASKHQRDAGIGLPAKVRKRTRETLGVSPHGLQPPSLLQARFLCHRDAIHVRAGAGSLSRGRPSTATPLMKGSMASPAACVRARCYALHDPGRHIMLPLAVCVRPVGQKKGR